MNHITTFNQLAGVRPASSNSKSVLPDSVIQLEYSYRIRPDRDRQRISRSDLEHVGVHQMRTAGRTREYRCQCAGCARERFNPPGPVDSSGHEIGDVDLKEAPNSYQCLERQIGFAGLDAGQVARIEVGARPAPQW